MVAGCLRLSPASLVLLLPSWLPAAIFFSFKNYRQNLCLVFCFFFLNSNSGHRNSSAKEAILVTTAKGDVLFCLVVYERGKIQSKPTIGAIWSY